MSYANLLFPLWGTGADKKNIIYLGSAFKKHGFNANLLKLVPTPQEAEYVLIPHEYWRLRRRAPASLEKMIAEAQRVSKPILIDAGGDEPGVVDVPNARVLRMNQFKFELPSYEIKIPIPCEDLLETYFGGELQIRMKSKIPSIGFVGWADMPLIQRLRSFTKELPIRLRTLLNTQYATKIKGVFWRERANRIFRASSRIRTNFIIRSSYSGNIETLEGKQEKNRQEFVDNIIGNDYALVIRGDANDATRFYEVLSLGRIPVLIDTSVVLPLETIINYREFCVIIDYKDLSKAPDILADFHAGISNEKFMNMQRKARDAFEHYLRYDAFTPHLVDLLHKP